MIKHLALKFRPNILDDIVGQPLLTSKEAPLRKLIDSGNMPHAFFFGPPGSGKTSMARVIAKILDKPFYEMDATSLKIELLRKIFFDHKNSLTRPLVFIDEVHRLSKTQQEVLLLPMENHEITIIGASTENPYFSISSGIRSRAMLIEFFPLDFEALLSIVDRVKKELNFEIEDEAISYLVSSSAGDSRALLNLLEFALCVDKNNISLQTLKSLRPNALKDGVSSQETHYNLISAMIKSIRGSDVNAALYYLARLIDGGESADFIARRLVILASEDIGNANPNALTLASSTLSAVRMIGYPEARIILSQCLIYLASSPKSNRSYVAINNALEYVRNNKALDIPTHLRSPSPKGYLYPHDFGGWVDQEYLHKKLKFFPDGDIGFEKTLNDWLEKIKNRLFKSN